MQKIVAEKPGATRPDADPDGPGTGVTRPLHPAEFAARMPGAQSGELGETLARLDGREPAFCPECRTAHAPGNVARCRHTVEQRIIEGLAAKLATPISAPPDLAAPALVNAPEAARLLGIKVQALYQRIERHQLPPGAVVRVGKRRLQFRRDKLVGVRS